MEVVRMESGPSDTQGRIAATADADADSSDLENKKKYVKMRQENYLISSLAAGLIAPPS